ncbi:hydroxyacyl-coenzyme A dehydrogenase [Martensiomyces pterosporus]|nr:hydroxyacyl-coenzyme A dehydrogenase [Martensiomyces pterosporus]
MSANAKETALRRQKQVLGHLSSEAQSQGLNPKATIKHVAVYGAGIMGGGIAQVSAQSGYQVTLWDMTQGDLDRGIKEIRNSVLRVARKQKKDDEWVSQVMGRISTTTDQLMAAQSADLLIEAIVERLDIKQKLFEALDKAAKPACIFATNTSSLLIKDISALVAEERKERTVALHFFNPVAVMRLVEIAYMDGVDQGLLDLLKAWVHDIGKVPVLCRDTPGFIVNRLLVPYNAEAGALVERGDATIEDVDIAMRLGAGYPMGPFELQDMTGLDTGYHIMKGWYESAPGLKGDPRFKPSPQVEKMLRDGHLGRKTGRGFYKYD